MNMLQPTNGHRCSSKPTWSSVVAGSNKTGQSDGLEIWRPGRLGSHLVVPPEPSMPTFLVFQSLVFKSDSLKPSGRQHSRLLCPLLSPRFSQIRVQWLDAAICLILCHFLLLPSIFPASGSFPVNQFFTSRGQSIGASALASVLPMNIQD